MDKKGQINLGMIIIMFVGIIVAIALFTPIIDTTNQLTSKQDVTNQSVSAVASYVDAENVNESINLTFYTQSTWKQGDCPVESVAIRNLNGTTLTADTDYTLYVNQGIFSLLNTSLTRPSIAENQTYVDYSHCADGYNKDASSRTIANLVLIFLALALLAFVLDKSGVIDMEKLIGR